MKRFGLAWCCLALGSLAGCSSSVANQDDLAPNRSAALDPEWVRDDSNNADAAIASQIQPIPESNEETADDEVPRVVRPIPDDGAQ